MASRKIKDLAVAVSEYEDRDGQTRRRYENVGTVMESDDGRMFLMLKRTFNPAGVPNPENRDTVFVSCFDPQQSDGGGQQRRQQGGGQQRQQGGGGQRQQQGEFGRGGTGLDDDIPF